MAPLKGALRPKNAETQRLGAQFRRLRESRGMGLRPLAEKMGISFYCIRRHEAGAMMLRTDDLYNAAKALRVRPAELLYIGEGND